MADKIQTSFQDRNRTINLAGNISTNCPKQGEWVPGGAPNRNIPKEEPRQVIPSGVVRRDSMGRVNLDSILGPSRFDKK